MGDLTDEEAQRRVAGGKALYAYFRKHRGLKKHVSWDKLSKDERSFWRRAAHMAQEAYHSPLGKEPTKIA